MCALPCGFFALALLAMSGPAALAMETGEGSFLPAKMAAPVPEGAAGLCATYRWACAGKTSDAELTPQMLTIVMQVNAASNAAIQPVTDRDQYGVQEVWALPGPGGGDCEDYALFKKRALIEAGVSPHRLLMAVVLDRRDEPHAVLILRTDLGDYVLDNVTNRILPWNQTGYTFVSKQNPDNPSRWVAVFERGSAPKLAFDDMQTGILGR